MSTAIPDFTEAEQAAAADVLVRQHGQGADDQLIRALGLDQTFGFVAPDKRSGSAP